MPINQNYVKAFRYRMMFGKDIRPGTTPISMDVLDKDDILLAIKKAYVDMSPRTFKPKSDIEIDSVAKESLLTKIAEKIQSYMIYGLSNISQFSQENYFTFGIAEYFTKFKSCIFVLRIITGQQFCTLTQKSLIFKGFSCF